MKSIIVLSGPTAAGKTALAMALAERYPVDLINVDSAQVYRGLDIGSAKPERRFLGQYPHALIDIRDPEQTYSVAEFIADARVAIDQSIASGRWPLLVGGTALYLRSLIYGLDPLPSADQQIRAAIQQRAEAEGWASLHAELVGLDPSLSSRIKPSDRQRIVRALEIHQLSGQRPSELMSDRREPLYRSLRLVVTPADRSVLHRLIKARLDQMMDQGFLSEVEMLKSRPELTAAHPAMRSVGYRQAWAFLELGFGDRETLKEDILAATRQLAKRQLTALRKLSQALWYDATSARLECLAGRQVATFMERAMP